MIKNYQFVGVPDGFYRVDGPHRRKILQIDSPLVYRFTKINRFTGETIGMTAVIDMNFVNDDIEKGLLKEYTGSQKN